MSRPLDPPVALKSLGAYLATVVASVVLTVNLMPSKTVEVVGIAEKVVGTAAAPARATEFMRALCDRDVEYIVKHIAPSYVSPEAIRSYEAQRAGTRRCTSPRYLGSFATDRHVFVARLVETGEENYWVITFEDGLVVDIE